MNEEPGKQQPSDLSQKENQMKKNARPVTMYLSILFLAALLLLLLSFFMQQRNHQALLDLNNSVTISQDVTELQMANQQLEFRVEEQEREISDLKKQQDSLTKKAEEAGKQAEALEWLRQIETATRSSYDRTRELVEAFEKTGLEKYLPDESAVEGGTSPAETYQNLYAALF